MARYFFIFLLPMVLPSMAVTPQQLIKGGQLLYEAIVKRDLLTINATVKGQAPVQDKLSLYKQARKIAKEKKDAQTTQYLTEQILDQQKNVYERHYIIAPLLAATVAFIVGCRLGVFVEKEGFIGRD